MEEAVQQGGLLAVRLKNLVYPGLKWTEIPAEEMGHRMKRMRDIVQILYPDYTIAKLYIEMNTYPNDEILDLWEGTEGLKAKKTFLLN